jgi:hypothetical protein
LIVIFLLRTVLSCINEEKIGLLMKPASSCFATPPPVPLEFAKNLDHAVVFVGARTQESSCFYSERAAALDAVCSFPAMHHVLANITR